MKAWIVRYSRGIRPAYEADLEAFRAMAVGTVLEVTARVVRNPKNHRRFFALVKLVREAYADASTDGVPHPYSTEKGALHGIKLAAGHVDWVPNPQTGEMIPVPASISFDALDEVGFQEFFSRAIDGVIAHLTPDRTREDVEQFILEVARFG